VGSLWPFSKDFACWPILSSFSHAILQFALKQPDKIFLHVQVDMALIPAVSGDFGVMPGHVPTVAELRPGIVAVHNSLDKDVEKFFVSGGFAVAHADSTVEVTVVEAANVEDIDPAAVKTGLTEYTARCLFKKTTQATCLGILCPFFGRVARHFTE
jgi:F0F1-type ATP synthase epsilon subunit